jgi:hypothetical protein
MKKLLLMVTLMIGVNGILFAQRFNQGGTRLNLNNQWNQVFEIELKNDQMAYVASTVTPLMLESEKYNLDSLVKVVMKKYKEIGVTDNETSSKSITYHYLVSERSKNSIKNHWRVFDYAKNPTEGFTIRTHKSDEKKYGILNGKEAVELKTTKDTLVINLAFGELPDEYKDKVKFGKYINGFGGYQLSFGFVVNNISNLETIDYQKITEEIKKRIERVKQEISFEKLMKEPDRPINTLMIAGTTNSHLYMNAPAKIDFLTLNARASGGYVRDKFVPEIGLNLTFISRKRIGLGIGVNQFYHFNNLPDNAFEVNTSNFVNVHFEAYQSDPRKKRGAYSQFVHLGGGSISYLVGKSSLFPKDTWRLSVTFPILKHLSVEPEAYFNGFFNQFYPGVRIKIM